MKKIILMACTVFTLAAFNEEANAQSFKKGDNVFSIGYGFPNLTRAVFSTYQDNNGFKFTGFGPVHAKIEHAVSDNFGIGLSINGTFNKINYAENSYNYAATYNSIKFNARFNYHFGNSADFDPYFGAGFGYGTSSVSWSSNQPGYSGSSLKNPIPIGFETTVGCRYFFSENIGVYVEGGIAKSIIQVGASFKF